MNTLTGPDKYSKKNKFLEEWGLLWPILANYNLEGEQTEITSSHLYCEKNTGISGRAWIISGWKQILTDKNIASLVKLMKP